MGRTKQSICQKNRKQDVLNKENDPGVLVRTSPTRSAIPIPSGTRDTKVVKRHMLSNPYKGKGRK